jgi:hypothetical protein
MFFSASAYSKGLCAWGQLLDQSTRVEDMFSGTSCRDPYLSPSFEEDPPGPFCSSCVGQNWTVHNLIEGPFALPLVPAAVTQHPNNLIVAWSGDDMLSYSNPSRPAGTFTCKFDLATKNASILRVQST